MKTKFKLRKNIAMMLVWLMLFTSIPLSGNGFDLPSYADVTVGTTKDTVPLPITISRVEFIRGHNGFLSAGGYLQIFGSNLKELEVMFDTNITPITPSGGFDANIGTRLPDKDGFLKFTFTADQVEALNGRMKIGDKIIDLQTTSFPSFSGVSTKNIFYQNNLISGRTPQDLTITGTDLNQINGTNITASYGTGSGKSFSYSGSDPTHITIVKPTPNNVNQLGYQFLKIEKNATISVSGSSLDIRVGNEYSNAFRFLDDIGLENVQMYPNTGAKGETVYINATKFTGVTNYALYLLKAQDPMDDFSLINKAGSVSTTVDVNGNGQIVATVPTHANFALGDYKVVIARVDSNNNVIASQTVMNADGLTPSIFTVVQASSPVPGQIVVSPNSGPDSGSSLILTGQNILYPGLAGLNGSAATGSDAFTLSSAKDALHVDYADGYTYKVSDSTTPAAVSVSRDVKITIGKRVFFNTKQDPAFPTDPTKTIPDVTKGSNIGGDSMSLQTDIIDDADTAPSKDVIVDVTTKLVDKNTGKIYIFHHVGTLANGYKFIPGSLKPAISKVNPPMVAVEGPRTPDNDFKLRNLTYLSIEGSNFLVDQYLDSNGAVRIRYPSILIKKNRDNTQSDIYQLAFFPNDSGSLKGVIKYKKEGASVPTNLTDSNGLIPVDITVLNSAGEVVTGIPGNDVGTRIILRMPDTSLIGDTGLKHIQIINPRRSSAEFGGTVIKNDAVEFVNTADGPAVNSVDPTILTTDGGQDVKITGKNFQPGMKIFLDGNEITGFTKVKAPGDSGDDIITFKSPKGREGITQLLLLNPTGGTTVRQITYVKVLQSAPTITNFTPSKGTPGTLVVINGDNFQKPDPTVTGTTGVDANRLIGTHVLFDGKDVNDYVKDSVGNILFLDYAAPANTTLIKNNLGRAEYSPFKENAFVELSGKLVSLGYDNLGNPMFTDATGKEYVFKYEGSGFKAYDRSDVLLGDVTITANTIVVGAPATKTFDVTMDNRIIFAGRSEDGSVAAKTANYVDSIVLQDTITKAYSTLTTDLKGNVILSNGKEDIYTITYESGVFKASKGGGSKIDVTVTGNKLTLSTPVPQEFTFKTPYVVDPTSGQIIGNRTKVITKSQITFTIPKDRGYTNAVYYDITVSNPDTKSDSRVGQNGFYLLTSAPNPPVISSIEPDKGSVEGGYTIKINGSSFDSKAMVYIDSVLVPAIDTVVAIDGRSIAVKVPKCTKDLLKDFKINRLSVPVVVVNNNGSTAYREKGFTYVKAASTPVITVTPPLTGSSNGGQIVEIKGDDIRFFEPYEDVNSNGRFDATVDRLTDLNGNATWDTLMPSASNKDALKVVDSSISGFGYYLKSPIMPRIYFGDKEAKIVEYDEGYLKVIAPAHVKGPVDLFLVNNDYGVSNKVMYTYTASSPKITSMIPNKGRRTGQEMKDIYGSEFYPTTIRGYHSAKNAAVATLDANADSTIVTIPDTEVKALVRFANIDNLSVTASQPNSGQINNQRAAVELTGGLKVEYFTTTTTAGALDVPALKMTVEESGKTYTRTFTNYDNSAVFLPMEMLQAADGKFYTPFNYTEADGSTYQNNIYEYIKVSVVDRMLKVERGYAPKALFDNAGHIMVMTPSYYSIDTVSASVYNNDGGVATTSFTYTNPASIPKIYVVNAYKPSSDGSYLMVEGAINGKIQIEILGQDLRKGATVTINGKPTTLVEQTTRVVGTTTYDVLIVQVPTGTTTDVDQKYPIVVQNEDGGLASSATLNNLMPDNYTKPDGTKATMPFFFIYRKALSGPKITAVSPTATSVFGGNTVTITGSDFRAGATIVIGSRGGVPVTATSVDPKGTSITFVTPKNLTLGAKDVQVINPDYGTDTKAGGLMIVSYPQTTAMYNENRSTISRLSTEGGETITIVGSGFMEGAKVIFGGTSTATGDPIGGNIGLWKNDGHFLMKDGVLGTDVKVLGDGALTVKTPVINTEGPIVITVINPDSGMSDGNLSTEYRLPIPTDVTTLSVKVVDKKYIELYNYTSKNLDYYEIYYYIGQDSEQALKGTNHYQDFKLLEVTDREPYKILDLPGYEERKSKDYVWFVVKAVNKYGASNYSNLAYLTNKDVEDLKIVGAPDLDGPAGVPKGKEYQAYVKDNALASDLSDALGNVSMTLTSFGPSKYPVRQINLPSNRVLGDYGTVQVDYGDTLIRIAPVALNTMQFAALNQTGKSYGQISISTLNNSYISSIKAEVPRSQKSISPAYQIGFSAISNKDKAEIKKLNGQMLLQFDYGRYPLTLAEESKLAVYKYNADVDQWQKITGMQNKKLDQVSIQVKEAGVYMLITTR